MHQDGFNSIQIMISKIISRAACLTELTSNSKSFSNCPDLHGGVPGLPGNGNGVASKYLTFELAEKSATGKVEVNSKAR
jgi:hypothetical protein